MYFVTQNGDRNGDPVEFFRREYRENPAALSKHGKLRQEKKSDLIDILAKHTTPIHNKPVTDVTLIDGPGLLYMIPPKGCKTFKEYAETKIVPHINSYQNAALRTDVLWEQYLDDSLKGQVRETRGNRIIHRRKVLGDTPIPKKWYEFLSVAQNKLELFALINTYLFQNPRADRELVASQGTGVVCYPIRETTILAPCDHDEADTRIFLHVSDALARGYSKMLIRSKDTDILVLSVSAAQKLTCSEIWVLVGSGNKKQYLAAHEIAASLGPAKSLALPGFHAYTGADTTAFFNTIGKKTAWNIWTSFPEVTSAFDLISSPVLHEQIPEQTFLLLERYTILCYNRTSSNLSIDKERMELFMDKKRQMANIPPTKAALRQKVFRTVLQAGWDWGQATSASRHMPSPENWGWKMSNGKWKPHWSDLAEAPKACLEFTKCRCRNKCLDCACTRMNIKCSMYCSCKGNCNNK